MNPLLAYANWFGSFIFTIFFVSCELPTCESSGNESSDSQSFQGADGSTVEPDLFAADDLLCRL